LVVEALGSSRLEVMVRGPWRALRFFFPFFPPLSSPFPGLKKKTFNVGVAVIEEGLSPPSFFLFSLYPPWRERCSSALGTGGQVGK